MKYLLPNILRIICIVGAIVVICLGKDGWGWLLFAGFLTYIWE